MPAVHGRSRKRWPPAVVGAVWSTNSPTHLGAGLQDDLHKDFELSVHFLVCNVKQVKHRHASQAGEHKAGELLRISVIQFDLRKAGNETVEENWVRPCAIRIDPGEKLGDALQPKNRLQAAT